jgi:predicted LPLAT superfamily acyltransferase
MTFGRRSKPPSRTKRFAAGDALFCLQIPLLFAFSWLLPEKHWHAVCSSYVKMRIKLGVPPRKASPIVSQVAGLRDIAENPAAFDVRHTALSTEDAFQVFRSYRPGGWNANLILEGEEHLRRALEVGKGAVLWVGNFCLSSIAAKRAIAEAGYKVWHLSVPEHGFSRTHFGIRFLNPICVRTENAYLAGRLVLDRANPSKATMAAARLLRKNNIVSITAQPSVVDTVARVKFLGGTFELAIGAPSLASLCGAPLLPVFAVREHASAPIQVMIGEPLTIPKTVDKAQALVALAQAFAGRLEPIVMKYPDQWRNWRALSMANEIAPSDAPVRKKGQKFTGPKATASRTR